MNEPSVDLRDTRGRLARFAVAVAIGLAVTIVVIRWIGSVSAPPNTDPVGSSTVGLLAIGIFVVSSSVALSLLAAIARRRQVR